MSKMWPEVTTAEKENRRELVLKGKQIQVFFFTVKLIIIFVNVRKNYGSMTTRQININRIMKDKNEITKII